MNTVILGKSKIVYVFLSQVAGYLRIDSKDHLIEPPSDAT